MLGSFGRQHFNAFRKCCERWQATPPCARAQLAPGCRCEQHGLEGGTDRTGAHQPGTPARWHRRSRPHPPSRPSVCRCRRLAGLVKQRFHVINGCRQAAAAWSWAFGHGLAVEAELGRFCSVQARPLTAKRMSCCAARHTSSGAIHGRLAAPVAAARSTSSAARGTRAVHCWAPCTGRLTASSGPRCGRPSGRAPARAFARSARRSRAQPEAQPQPVRPGWPGRAQALPAAPPCACGSTTARVRRRPPASSGRRPPGPGGCGVQRALAVVEKTRGSGTTPTSAGTGGQAATSVPSSTTVVTLRRTVGESPRAPAWATPNAGCPAAGAALRCPGCRWRLPPTSAGGLAAPDGASGPTGLESGQRGRVGTGPRTPSPQRTGRAPFDASGSRTTTGFGRVGRLHGPGLLLQIKVPVLGPAATSKPRACTRR